LAARAYTDDVELGALADVVGGEGVAQRVGRRTGDRRFGEVLTHDGADGAGADRFLKLRQEERLFVLDLRADR